MDGLPTGNKSSFVCFLFDIDTYYDTKSSDKSDSVASTCAALGSANLNVERKGAIGLGYEKN